MIDRRSALKTIALAAVAAPAILHTANAQGRERVKITLPWLPDGAYAYMFIAKAGGYWRDRGLDVDLARGTGALTAAEATAQGQFDLGLSTAEALVLLAGKGIDLRSIAIPDYDPTMGIAVLDKSPIRSPKDLEGKKVGQTLSSSDAPFFAPFCARNDVDLKKVELLSMDPRVRNQALADGRVDAITGQASSILATLGANGTRVRFMLYSDYGVVLYGNDALVAPSKLIAERPALCQAVTDGILEAMKFTITKPMEAQAMFLEAVPEIKMTATGAEFAGLGMGVQRFAVLAGSGIKENGLGWADLGKLKTMSDFVMKYQAAPGSVMPDIEKLFTNQFIGHVRMSDAEFAAAGKETEWVAQMLGKKV